MNIYPFWLNNHVVVMGLLALQGKITFPLPEILWMMEVPPHPHTHSCGGAFPALHGNPFLNQWFLPFFRHQCFPVQQCYGGLGRVSPSHFPVQPLFDDAFPPLRMALFVQSAHATPDPTFVAWSRGPANMWGDFRVLLGGTQSSPPRRSLRLLSVEQGSVPTNAWNIMMHDILTDGCTDDIIQVQNWVLDFCGWSQRQSSRPPPPTLGQGMISKEEQGND